MFKFAGILFCGALFFLAGCATQPAAPPPEVIGGTGPVISSPLNWTNPAAAKLFAPQPSKPAAPVVSTVFINKPPVTVSTPAPVTTWTSLNRWAAAHNIGAPRRLPGLPVTSYALGSKNGVMVLVIGSHEATWNGVEINLGFAPEFIDGEVFLHGLDLQKNLEPLLCAPPLEFGASRVIVIDPGHGGDNHGTYIRSVLEGPFEKEFTLDWARRLKPLLETNGWKVFLTRTNDMYVTNSDRVVFAEAHHADLFVSLHFNSTDKDKKNGKRDEKTGGLETYCVTPAGMPSTLTRGFADPWSEHLPNNAFDAQNLQLAVRVQSILLRTTGIEDRGVRHSRFDTVLRGQNRPAILIEGGYLSNPREAALIESAEYRQKLAEAVANALK
ncbi:MAG: N-acetylmuramoyl-L-alanine amidase [Verrucomicrobiota bacterium]